MFNPNYQPIPNLSLPTYRISDRNMSKGDYSIIQQSTVSATKLITLPKKPLPGGEEISLGDLTIPPTLTEIRKREPKKITLIQPSDQLEENLDKNMIKTYNLIDDRMELKIIPFKYEGKINNERFI